MNPETRRKWVAYGALIFITGALSGVMFGWGQGARRMARPPAPMGAPSGKHLCDHFREAVGREFSLDSARLEKLDPILEQRAKKYDEIFDRSRKELDSMLESSNKEVADVLGLNDDQRSRLPELGRPRRFGGREGGGFRRPGDRERYEPGPDHPERRERRGGRGDRPPMEDRSGRVGPVRQPSS